MNVLIGSAKSKEKILDYWPLFLWGESEDSGEEVRFDKIIDSSSSFFYQLLPRKERYDEDTSAFFFDRST